MDSVEQGTSVTEEQRIWFLYYEPLETETKRVIRLRRKKTTN
jgi:hypothetical protein